MNPIKDLLTIVIPAKNESNYIARILSDLSTQKEIQGTLVLVADGGSTDGTQEIVNSCAKQYKDQIQIKLIKGGSVSQGRNAGLALTTTPYVLFIDADVFLYSATQILETRKLLIRKRLVGARLHCKGSRLSRFSYYMFNQVNRIISLFRPFVVGSYFATHTSSICNKGGWDERLVHSEDWDLSGKYKSCEFARLKDPIYVDDRRLQKMGHLRMFAMLLKSAIFGRKYQTQDNGYWDNYSNN